MPVSQDRLFRRAFVQPFNLNRLSFCLFCLLCLTTLLAPDDSRAIGGNGGSSFVIQCTGNETLMQVTLRAGRRIDSVGIVCLSNTGVWRQQTVGGTGGTPHTINLGAAHRHAVTAQIAIGKCGRNTTRVCGLMLVSDTNFGQRYGTLTHDNRQFNAGRNQELVGFRGRAGDEIDNLDVIWRNRTRPAFSQTRRIDADQIGDAINMLFSTMVLKVNNLGERRGNSWHDPESGYISLLGIPRPLAIPEFTYRPSNWRRRYFYYANDINATSARIWFNQDWQAYVLRIDFEDAGREIKGKCRLKKANDSYKACPGPNEGDGDAPDVQWAYPALEITLVPRVVARPGRRNGIGLRAENVRLRGNFNMNGLCGALPNRCQTLLNGWKGAMITGIEGNLMTAINAGQVQRAMADATRPLLNAAGVPSLTDVVVTGSDLELRW